MQVTSVYVETPMLVYKRLFCCLLLATLPPYAIAQTPPPVIGHYATATAWSDPLEALGTLRADESVTLSATVTDTIAEITFEDGAQVEQGELLIRLEDAEEQALLRAARAITDERRNAVGRTSQLQERNLAPPRRTGRYPSAAEAGRGRCPGVRGTPGQLPDSGTVQWSRRLS